MNPGRTALKATLAVSLLFAVLAQPSRGQEQEVPRKPRGPAAGPVIKLPRGEGAPLEERQPAEAQKAQQAAPQKWEYCAITGFVYKQREVGLTTRNYPAAVIHCYPNLPEEVEAPTHDLALATALARLGDEGWELVGIREKFSLSEGTGHSSPVFYFKRPKRQE